MIPFVKSSTSSNKKIYVGKIVHDGGDFATVLSMLNAKLKGENVLNLTVKQTRDIGAKYSISIKEEGINITASTEGSYPAFSTLIKLVREDENGTYFLESAIFDQARFSYRSAMLDDARYFHGKENVKKFLDVLFNLKFSVFHWHLSDDQGFRLLLDGIEDVCEKASKRKNSRVGGYVFGHADGKEHQGIYTKEDVWEIIEYAKDRGIKVIPEIDLPGHFSAILSAKPEFSCDGKQIDVPYQTGVLENVLCLGNQKAREFAKDLLLKTAKLFDTDVMHVGFDEIKTNKLKKCPKCQERIKALGLNDEKALIENFRVEVRDFLKSNGVNIICWNDGLTEVDRDCVVQHWKFGTDKETVKRINDGQRMIISDFYHYYMDYPYSMTPLKKTYYHEPVFLGVEKKENIIGIEAPFWAEWAKEWDKIKFNGYYRLACVAETAWNEEKRPYEVFMEDLRKNEEEYFGERLDISEKLLNPKFKRLKFIRYVFSDNQIELKKWQKSKREK